MHGITKRVAFLADLVARKDVASARSVGESVEARHGEEFATEGAERNAILNSLAEEGLAIYRAPKPTERQTKQQRYVFGANAAGKAEVVKLVEQAKIIVKLV